MRTFIFLLASFLVTSIQGQLLDTRPLITVTGEAVEKIMPDMVIIRYTKTLKISASDGLNTLTFNQDKNDMDMKFINVSSDDITRCLDVIRNTSPNYLKIREYIITLTDMNKYLDIIHNLLQLNVGEITSVEFRTSRLEELKGRAQVKALQAAREKAGRLASALNQNIGKGYKITEEPSPVINWYERRFPDNSGDAPTGSVYLVEPGYITISAKLTVSFDLN